MNTVYFFEDHGVGWTPRTSHEGPLNNGHIWNCVQPLLDQDLAQTGECADRVLLVEVYTPGPSDAGPERVRAEEYTIKAHKVQLFNRDGRPVGR